MPTSPKTLVSPDKPAPQSEDDLFVFVKTPAGLARFADVIREARHAVAGSESADEVRSLIEFENKLRAAAARGLQPDFEE